MQLSQAMEKLCPYFKINCLGEKCISWKFDDDSEFESSAYSADHATALTLMGEERLNYLVSIQSSGMSDDEKAAEVVQQLQQIFSWPEWSLNEPQISENGGGVVLFADDGSIAGIRIPLYREVPPENRDGRCLIIK